MVYDPVYGVKLPENPVFPEWGYPQAANWVKQFLSFPPVDVGVGLGGGVVAVGLDVVGAGVVGAGVVVLGTGVSVNVGPTVGGSVAVVVDGVGVGEGWVHSRHVPSFIISA